MAAINQVKEIIEEELSNYNLWLQEAPLRELLGEYKIRVDQKVKELFESEEENYNLNTISNQVMRKLIKQPVVSMHVEKIDAIITEQVSLVKESYS